MSALEFWIKPHASTCLAGKYTMMGSCNCGRFQAEEELFALHSRIAELEADNHRLAQENIRLNNNEDFLDGRIAELETELAELNIELRIINIPGEPPEEK
jgi:predicted nuclease with TOPRIM domain